MTHAKALGGKIITPPIVVLSVLFLIGVYFLVLRYVNGIGYVANVTHQQSWGMWKVVGVLVGAAFVNGGYVTAFFVYIINRGAYHRFVRQAVLFSLLGYSFAAFSLVYDTGRYVNLLNFFIPKYMQTNSVLFEVGICITAYILILGIEFLPAFLERFMPGEGKRNVINVLHEFLNKILFLTVAFGVLLPTMHQSGLGGLALLFGYKLSPLWQTPFISLIYVISSIFMGFSIVTIIECLYADRFKKQYTALLGTLMRAAFFVAVVYIVFRWVEIIRAGAVGKAFTLNTESVFFWLEWVLILVGLFFCRSKSVRSKPNYLFLSACLLMSGGLLYRLNTYIIGFQSVEGQFYFPSFPEVMISVGLIAFQLILFITFVKIFPVIEKE